MGINKKDLLNHYYADELCDLFYEYQAGYLDAANQSREIIEYVDAGRFMGF